MQRRPGNSRQSLALCSGLLSRRIPGLMPGFPAYFDHHERSRKPPRGARPMPFLPARSRLHLGWGSQDRAREAWRRRSQISRARQAPRTEREHGDPPPAGSGVRARSRSLPLAPGPSRGCRSGPARPGDAAHEPCPGRRNTEASDCPRGRVAHLAAGIGTPTPGTPQARPQPTNQAKPKLKSPRRRRFSVSANHCFP